MRRGWLVVYERTQGLRSPFLLLSVLRDLGSMKDTFRQWASRRKLTSRRGEVRTERRWHLRGSVAVVCSLVFIQATAVPPGAGWCTRCTFSVLHYTDTRLLRFECRDLRLSAHLSMESYFLLASTFLQRTASELKANSDPNRLTSHWWAHKSFEHTFCPHPKI